MKERSECWSFGGGTQSAAIAVLVKTGKLPQPKHIVIADTGREAQSTWDYMEQVIEPYLGRKITRAPHDLATVDLYSGNGDLLMPMFTATGKLPTFCSTEWKRRVVHRSLRQLGVETCRLWMGVSVDEIARAKPSGIEWIEHRFPLLMDVPMRRGECVEIVRRAGLPDPPRSSCWCCPHRSDAEWAALPAEEFQKAVSLEAAIRQRDSNVFLHRARVPLGEVDLAGSKQSSLWGECDAYCWT